MRAPSPKLIGLAFQDTLKKLHELNQRAQQISPDDEIDLKSINREFAKLGNNMAAEYQRLLNPEAKIELINLPSWTQVTSIHQSERNTTRLNLELMLLHQPSIQQALANLKPNTSSYNPKEANRINMDLQRYLTELQADNPQQYQQLLSLSPALNMARALKNKAQGPAGSWDKDLDASMTTTKQNLVRNLIEIYEDEIEALTEEQQNQDQAEAEADADADADSNEEMTVITKQDQKNMLKPQPKSQTEKEEEEAAETDVRVESNKIPSWITRTLERKLKRWLLLKVEVSALEEGLPALKQNTKCAG